MCHRTLMSEPDRSIRVVEGDTASWNGIRCFRGPQRGGLLCFDRFDQLSNPKIQKVSLLGLLHWND